MDGSVGLQRDGAVDASMLGPDVGTEAGHGGGADSSLGRSDGATVDADTGVEGASSDGGSVDRDGEGTPDGSSSHDASPATDAAARDAGETGDAGGVDGTGGDGGVQDSGALDAVANGPPANEAGTDASGDAGCTPQTGAAFQCGAASCNGATNYCLETSEEDTCVPMPPACECAETDDCTCLLANVANPCGVGIITCAPRDDGGLLWAMALDCP